MNVNWFKMYPETWLSDPQVRMCKPEDRGVLMDLMCLMHKGKPYGHLTSGGKAIPVDDLKTVLNVPKKTLNAALKRLEERTRIAYTVDRVIYCPRMVEDAKKHAILSDYGGRGGNPALKRKASSPAVPSAGEDASTWLNTPAGGFAAFWAEYPLSVGRAKAEAAYSMIMNNPADMVCGIDIIEGAKRYAKHVRKTGTSPDFVTRPATWLKDARWTDVYEVKRAPQHTGTADEALRIRDMADYLEKGQAVLSWRDADPPPFDVDERMDDLLKEAKQGQSAAFVEDLKRELGLC